MSEIPDTKGTMPDAPKPVVVALETDLFFSVRIEDAARAAGARPVVVESAAALGEAIEAWPELVLIDLAAAPGWDEVVRRAKSLPEFRAIPIVAFGSHIDIDTLKAARHAGCDHAWARSHFTTELPLLIQRTLHPPTRWVAGWDEPPPSSLLVGVGQFNTGEYWECHETLETLWRAEPRPVRDLYQGILQIGVAFYHLRHGNLPGAIKMLRRGLPRLHDLPEICQGVRATELARAARAIHDRAAAREMEGAGPLDLGALPTITIVLPVV
jgi:uncharacterized protein